MNRVRFGMRHVIRFDFTNGLSKAHLLCTGKRRHFDELSLLPKETTAARTELVKHGIKQTRRGRNRSEGSKGDVHLVNLIESVRRPPGHQIRDTGRRAAPEADGHTGSFRLFIKLKLARGIE